MTDRPLDRIVCDILKFPQALAAIIEVEGAVVPEMDTRTGRRKDMLHIPVHHPDCAAAVAKREAKWDAEEQAYGELNQEVSSEEESDDE